MTYSYIYSKSTDDAGLYKLLGRKYTCPWCEVASVRKKIYAKRNGVVSGNLWVLVPLQIAKSGWVCITCYLDVYMACNSTAESYAKNPDRRLVSRLAQSIGISSKVFRYAIWMHQLQIIDENTNSNLDVEKLSVLKKNIETYIKNADMYKM